MSEWQPIDTAPKDGTVIDVWGQQDYPGAAPERITDVYWGLLEPDSWDRKRQSKCCWIRNEDIQGTYGGYEITMMPTHWMPLPAPPLTEWMGNG